MVRIGDLVGLERKLHDINCVNSSEAGTCGVFRRPEIIQAVNNSPNLSIPMVDLRSLAPRDGKLHKTWSKYGWQCTSILAFRNYRTESEKG